MSQPITHDTQRLVDLVRYCRGYLHDEGLITGDEYAALVEVGSDAARRLESYDEVRARLAVLEAERAALRQWVRDEGERTDTCTYNVLREVCEGCRCHRATSDAGRTGGEGV